MYWWDRLVQVDIYCLHRVRGARTRGRTARRRRRCDGVKLSEGNTSRGLLGGLEEDSVLVDQVGPGL